ncbi:flagellar protein export ATPase FliI [Bacillus gobiensis]|uniref:flagellar protein export ATPase FliI n=1 Tax=Bacillus gobiensis TaxID=1441095 RepID=UPI003D211575
MNTARIAEFINSADSYKRYGKVKKVVGLMIESKGPVSSIGDVCLIHGQKGVHKPVKAEVVGFRDEYILLMPYLTVANIAPGSIVESTGSPLKVKVGQSLKGLVLNAFGEPLDESLLPKGLSQVQIDQEPPNPMNRPPIDEKMTVGVKAIDGLLTIGKGQRVGIFAGSGVGKSTLIGMIAKQTTADINVIALVGERGREVREFIDKELGSDGLKRSIVVAATSDQPALMRLKAAYTATSIAEFFRDQGKNVMLIMDSVTRVAMAQREIGLAAGEPPATKGYTPSVFAILPRLLERTGTDKKGSITAFYTVLVDGDDLNEPISDTVRGILDGHIVLDRELANKGQFPAIHILKSVSRVMNNIVSREHKEAASRFRNLLSVYQNNEDLITIGAYKPGSSKEIDEAIHFQPKLISFLKQGIDGTSSMEESISALLKLIRNEV